MRTLVLVFALTVVIGCSESSEVSEVGPAASSAAQSSPASERGGTITVGEDSWTIAKFGQCASYPGDVVSIWGYSTDDPPVEITIDYGGPTGAKIGEEYPHLWEAERETLTIQIDGRRIQGSATFFRFANGQKVFAQGTFEMNC